MIAELAGEARRALLHLAAREQRLHADLVAVDENGAGSRRLARIAQHLAVGGHPIAGDVAVEALAEELPDLPVQIVGDAFAPRLMRNAISEGFKAGAFA